MSSAEKVGNVTKHQPALGQFLFEIRAQNAGLDARGTRHRIDIQNAVHAAQIDGAHHARIGAMHFQTSCNICAATERDDDNAEPIGSGEQPGNLVFVVRINDAIGSEIYPPMPDAPQIACALAIGMQQPIEIGNRPPYQWKDLR